MDFYKFLSLIEAPAPMPPAGGAPGPMPNAGPPPPEPPGPPGTEPPPDGQDQPVPDVEVPTMDAWSVLDKFVKNSKGKKAKP
jgi:hypothetical protein